MKFTPSPRSLEALSLNTMEITTFSKWTSTGMDDMLGCAEDDRSGAPKIIPAFSPVALDDERGTLNGLCTTITPNGPGAELLLSPR
jgi:hypothetical protein